MKMRVREYLTPEGVSPYRKWLADLDLAIRARIQARVLRFELGNLGDHRAVGGGVWEARLMFGPGYRLYFGKVGGAVILLLLGGDKGSQPEEVRRARRYWDDYLEGARRGTAQ